MGKTAQNTSKRYIGDVYFNNDEMIHLRSFIHKDGSKATHDARTRFAYMIISKEEALKLSADLSDPQAVLNAAKDKYLPTLSKAIKEESKRVNHSLELRPDEIKLDNKLIYLISSPATNATCEETLLKKQQFLSAAAALPKEKTIKNEKRHIAYLIKSIKACKTDLMHEHSEFDRKTLKSNEKMPYILLSMPYVYNSIRDNNYNITKYEHTTYEEYFNISLMPKVRVEFGVFFDGTNNNMYNIDFYRGHKAYLTDVVEYVQNNKTPFDNDDYSRQEEDYRSFKEYIAKHPDPQKTNTIMNRLRNELISDDDDFKIRYFQPSSTIPGKYGNDNASKDADKIFDFAYEIRENLTGSESDIEKWWEERTDDFSKSTGTPEDIHEYILDKIIPESSEIGSYVNGYTNIKRLYEHYKGHDRLNPDANDYSLTRFKVYAAGSGTVDPIEARELRDNETTGLAAGISSTGVKAHVVYTCKKIAQELRESGIEHVDELVFDVFGFSRGATEARHFVCSIQKEFELLNSPDETHHKYTLKIDPEENKRDLFTPFFDQNDGLFTTIADKYARHFNPLRTELKSFETTVSARRSVTLTIDNPYYKQSSINIENVAFRHVGIGDTVTHRGIVQSNDFKELNLEFDEEKVGTVYHLMAMDEYRYNFDAYSIFKKDYENSSKVLRKNSKGNMKEFIVPGAHADVGGGYETFGDSKLIFLGQGRIFTPARIQQWNSTYEWLPQDKLKQTDNIDSVNKDGIYRYIIEKDPYDIESFDIEHGYYMYRDGLSWEYELVTLKLFHREATTKNEDGSYKKEEKERVPFEDILPQYNLAKLVEINQEKYSFLNDTVLNTLLQETYLDKETHKTLRQKYLHHSLTAHISFDTIANIPNPFDPFDYKTPEGEIYPRRSIYGTEGDKFANLTNLAYTLATQQETSSNVNQPIMD